LIDQRTPAGHFNPLYDAQGDIIALASTTGKVERTFHYGPYGENTKSEGTQTIPYPFGYKSGYRMPGGNKGLGNVSNGLYHYGQRYYDPTTGRWTQPDPLAQVASPVQADRFLFAGSDPINMSDPSGNGFIEEGLEAIGEFGLSEAGGAVVGCLAVGSAYLETGPYGAAAACAVGGYIGYEGGDTSGAEL
jgi:RHS repeat-associated protein